jgi:hypothetical protein
MALQRNATGSGVPTNSEIAYHLYRFDGHPGIHGQVVAVNVENYVSNCQSWSGV